MILLQTYRFFYFFLFSPCFHLPSTKHLFPAGFKCDSESFSIVDQLQDSSTTFEASNQNHQQVQVKHT